MSNITIRRLIVAGLAIAAVITVSIIFGTRTAIALVAGMGIWAFLQNVVLHDTDATTLSLTQNWDVTAVLVAAGILLMGIAVLFTGLAQPLLRFVNEAGSRFEGWFLPVLLVGIVLFAILVWWSRRRVR